MSTLARWLAGVAVVAGAAFVGFIALFSAYGFSQGFDVASGLKHLLAEDFDAAEAQRAFEDVPWQRVSWVADIESRALNESSGLAASNLHEGVLWSINDSGSGPAIYAMDLEGRDLGVWPVETEQAVDWESMDAFVWQDTSYLIIGDTGDNFRWRREVQFLVVEEPADLAAAGAALPVAWRVTFSYPQGYRDSEALAVDAANEQVYVLSKRRHPPQLFRLPLRADAPVVAEYVRTLTDFPRPMAWEIEEDDGQIYRHTPVGMDLANGRLLIATYKHAYVYLIDALEQPPLRIRMPSVGQREAVSFASGRDDVAFVSRERSKGRGVADLFMIEFALDPSDSASVRASARTLPEAIAAEQ